MKRMFLCFCLCVLSIPVLASTIVLEVSGTGTPQAMITGDAAAVAFHLGNPYAGLSISAPVSCIGSCDMVVFLSNALDASFHDNNLILAAPVTSSTLFSGLDLASGTYFLTIAPQSGVMVWEGSMSPTVAGLTGNSDLASFLTRNADPIAPGSRFDFEPTRLAYTIEQATLPIPEPASTGYVVLALALFLTRRRSWR